MKPEPRLFIRHSSSPGCSEIVTALYAKRGLALLHPAPFPFCPGCQGVVAIPDIGSRTPPGTEVVCAYGDAIGVLYTADGPILSWWRPKRQIVVRNALAFDGIFDRMTESHAMSSPDDPEVVRAIREAALRVEDLHAELRATYPALRESMAIPGMLVGHGLGTFVVGGMTDDQIVAQVLSMVVQIRQHLAQFEASATVSSDSDVMS